jgi:hypothetical protein
MNLDTLKRDDFLPEWGDIDWLGVAIGRLGGPGRAATKLGISRQQVYRWLEAGLGQVSFAKIVLLSELSRIPLYVLAERLEPYRPLSKRKR